MIPPAAFPAPVRQPAPRLTAPLVGKLNPGAAVTFAHLPGGAAKGVQVSYTDLNACVWYVGAAGRVLRGASRWHRRGLSGIEDGAHNERR